MNSHITVKTFTLLVHGLDINAFMILCCVLVYEQKQNNVRNQSYVASACALKYVYKYIIGSHCKQRYFKYFFGDELVLKIGM